MALTPVGPFCPFRSTAAIEVEPKMERLNSVGPKFATDMARIQFEMQMGRMPDPEQLKSVADSIDESVDDWENLVTRLRLSHDFQTREYAKLTQAHLQNHNETVEDIATMMRWQAGCMRAMANNTPPPMPPPSLDLAKLMEQQQQQQQQQKQQQQEGDGNDDSSTEQQKTKPPPSISAMTAAEKITATPFTGDEPAFDSPTVKSEYEQLCKDHVSLIEFGNKYDSFDPVGKLYYLDEIEKIEERWDVFFARFKLMGALNAQYIEQCNAFLASMGMTETEYRQLLKQAHDLMRKEAEAQRNNFALEL